MTMRERADLGFVDALEEFDPADWAPKPAPRPEKAGTRKAAAARPLIPGLREIIARSRGDMAWRRIRPPRGRGSFERA